LLSLGADVRYVDEHVPDISIAGAPPDGQAARVSLTAEELNAAHAVVVLTDHDDIDYELVAANAPYVLDTRHRCQGSVVEYL
jgi:UDP-N-acetyl-D-mannosaminuronate dehydrogenase